MDRLLPNKLSRPRFRRTLQWRVIWRVLTPIIVTFVVLVIVAAAAIQIYGRQFLREQTAHALASATESIERELADSVNGLVDVATSSTMRNYARLTSATAAAEFTEEQELLQADLLGAFDDLISRNRDRFLAIRYIARDGRARGEVINVGSETQVVTEVRELAIADDPGYVAAITIATPDEAFLGSVTLAEGQDDFIHVYVPVTALGNQTNVLGVLQLELSIDPFMTIAGDVLSEPLVSQEGRRVLVVDNLYQVIGDSSPAEEDISELAAFVSRYEGEEIVQRSAGDNMVVSSSNITQYEGMDTPWHVILVDQHSLVLAPLNQLTLAVIALLTAVTVVLLVRIGLSLRPVTRPIVSARSMMERFVNKDEPLEGTQLTDLTRQDDDLGRLLAAVAEMAQRMTVLRNTLETQVGQRDRDLTVAARIGREMATLYDIDTLLNRAINLICDEMGYYHAQVFLVDDAGINAVLAHSRGRVGKQLLAQNFKIPIGSESVIGTVTAKSEPIIVNDTMNTKGIAHQANPLLPETRAEIGLPLFIGDQVIGVLDIQSKRPDAFVESDLPALSLLADQLAVAIYNARLVNQTERRLQQIDTLNRQLTHAAWEEAGQHIQFKRGYRYNLLNVEPVDELPSDEDGGLSSPISIRGEMIGTLSAEPVEGQDFSSGDRVILQSVADRVALAVENARLFQETQASLTETTTLYQLSRYLNETNTLEDIIQAVIISVMPDAACGQVWMFDEYPQEQQPEWMEVAADLAIDERDESNENLTGVRLHIPDHEFLRGLSDDRVTLVNDTSSDARLDERLQQVFLRLNAKASVLIPLTVRGVWRGLIMIGLGETREFGEHEGRIYTALIDQAGVAIDNRLLLQQTEEEVARNESLYAASRIINTAENIQDLVYAAVATASDPDLNFSLSLLEGQLDQTGWPTQAHIVAESDGGAVSELDDVYPVDIPKDSPLRNREPEILVDDRPDDDSASPTVQWMRSRGYRFMATFPLFSANQPIALFRIVSAEVRDLSARDYEVYRALSGQMSSQIQIRSLLERTEQALDETRRLYIASRAIASAQDSQEVYLSAVEHLARALVQARIEERLGQTIKIALLMAAPDPVPDAPDLEYAYIWNSDGDTDNEHIIGNRVSSLDYPYGRLTSDADGAIYFENIAEDEIDPTLRDRLLAEGAGSLAVAPLTSRQNWFGVIVCQSDQTDAFDEQYTRFLQAVAGQVAIAVENQRLFDEARYEADRAQSEAQRALALAEAAQLANRIGDDFEQGLREVFERVADVAGFDRWMLLFLDDEGEQLEKVTARAPDFDDVQPLIYSLETELPVVDVVRLNRSLIVNDPNRYPALENLYDESEREALIYFYGKHIAMPVRIGPQVVGSLFVGRDLAAEDLDERDEQLVQTLAAQVGVAVENRRLFQRIQREQENLRSILETLPAGVLVLDPETLKPLLFNRQVEEYLGREVDLDMPFSVEAYNLYRTGTQLHYPVDEMPIFTALSTGMSQSSDDVAVIIGDTQIDLLVNAAPITDERGDITSIVVAFQDISNLRSLENTLQENLRETVALYEAQRQLSEATELDDVLDVILAQLAMLQPNDAYVFLREENGTLHTARHLMEPFENPEVLAEILMPQESLLAGDINHLELNADTRELLEAMNVRSLMTVPLRVSRRDQAVGWIMIASDLPDAFPPDQERVLSQLGDVASTAIDNRFLIQTQQAAVQEMRALYNTTTSISRARDLEQLKTVLQNAMPALSPDYYAGFLDASVGLREEAETLFNVAGEDLTPIDFQAIFLDYAVPVDGVYVDDLREVENPGPAEKALLEAGVQAMAAVNLRPRDVPGGVLVVAYREPHEFRDNERRYLSTMADGASIVFNNILLFDQIQNTLEETSILYQASRALTDATSAEDILDVVVNYLILPHISQVFVALLTSRSWDSAGASVEVVASWSDEESLDLEGVSLTAEQFPAWNLLATPDVLAIDDIYADSNLSPMEQMGIESLDTRSVTIIPLRVAKREIGAVWLGSREVHVHAEREARTYRAFAEQASLSLEASYLLQQTERRARQLETSAQVSQAAGQILDLQVLLPRLVDLIKDSFGYDHVQVFLIDDYDEYAVLRASTGEAGRQLLEIKHKLKKGSDSVIGRVTAQAEPQIALDTADASVVHQPNPYLPLTRSEMALPLVVKGRVVGALDVQSNQPNAFNEEDVKALTTLASQIAIAIDNANLYEAAQEQAGKMSFLFEVTSAAAAAETLDDALQMVADLLYNMLNALSVTIYLPQTYVDDHDNIFETLQAVAAMGTEQPLSEIEEIHADDPDNLVSIVGQKRRSRVVDDVTQEEQYLPVVSTARSAALLPLTTGSELIGLITIEDQRPHAFDDDMLQLMRTLAGSLSAVVQSAQLLEQVQKTNEQLRELDRLKSDFLANMSHELRTPLNSIIGFSRVMLKGIDGPLTEMQEQDLTTIFNSGQHLLMLINDILDQAKIAAGKMDMKYAYFEVKPLVEAVKSIGVGLVKDKPVTMQAEIAANLPKCYGDEFRTRQVLLNLVSNAAKFTSDGMITIRVYPIEDVNTGKKMIRIDVEDTGIGIAENDLPLLFEAFRQIDSSLTRTQGGTGLGLPIAKSLVEMQGGEMMVESEANTGSTFSITVPTEPTVDLEDDEDGEEESREAPPAAPDGNGAPVEPRPTMKIDNVPSAPGQNGPSSKVMQAKREILLIEDNKDMVDQFRRVLQREGFDVQTADHPAYAEAMASNLRPTVIVMDVNFADGEGWNILARLKDRDDTFDIPVIVVSLNDETDRAYQAGVHTFIQRPFVPEDLVEAVLAAEEESNMERILIIDDQPDSIRLLTQLLNESGTYRVFSAETAMEGISLVARRRPDLIILDLRMPEMDGFAVLRELRSNPETATIPVLVVTGEVDFESDEQKQLANVHVLHKTDISQEEYQQFINDVRKHLDVTEEN